MMTISWDTMSIHTYIYTLTSAKYSAFECVHNDLFVPLLEDESQQICPQSNKYHNTYEGYYLFDVYMYVLICGTSMLSNK